MVITLLAIASTRCDGLMTTPIARPRITECWEESSGFDESK